MSRKYLMIPMKGKGHEQTAKNRKSEDETEIAYPLTTDPWDNALLIVEDDGTE